MDWLGILAAAVAGGLAAGLASLVLRRRSKSGAAFAIVTGLVFLGLHGIAREFVLPPLRASQAVKDLPIYTAIKRLDPKAAEELKRTLEQIVRSGQDRSLAGEASTRSMIAQLAAKHAAKASDESVVHLVRVSTANMQKLSERDPRVCYLYLFPQKEQPVDFRKYLDKADAQKEVDALTAVLESAGTRPLEVPTDAQVGPSLQVVVERLSKRFGEKRALAMFEAFEKAADGNSDARIVCDAGIAMFSEILELPESQRGPTLRVMFSQAD